MRGKSGSNLLEGNHMNMPPYDSIILNRVPGLQSFDHRGDVMALYEPQGSHMFIFF